MHTKVTFFFFFSGKDVFSEREWFFPPLPSLNASKREMVTWDFLMSRLGGCWDMLLKSC